MMLFALADCNNFYASCERIFNPKLMRRPIVVLSNNDGCIITRSAEAKKLGIKMGEPYFKAKKIIDSLEGRMVIKYYPTRSATVNTLSAHLKQLELKNIKPDLVVVDYSYYLLKNRNC